MKRCKVLLSRCRVLELPLHLLNEILCRLTVDTIFSCKCVCKTFLEILTDRHFVELHLTRSAASVIDDGLILYDIFNISSFLLVYNDGRRIEHDNTYSPPCQTMATPAAIVSDSMFSIIGACNGLLCLRYTQQGPFYPIYYICNPILGEFFALPPVVMYSGFQQSRFGFCQKTKQYKVIQFVNTQCMVYTLGSDEHYWRKIGNVPSPPRFLVAIDCSLNGNLHWITSCNTTTVSTLICSFNLETEHFTYISPPTLFSQDDFFTQEADVRIGLLGGFLCLSYRLGVKYEAFVMKDYDGMNEGCWTKEISVDLISDFRLQGMSFNYAVVSLLNNGDLLLQQRDSHSVICLDIHNGVTKYRLADRVTMCGALSFLPSFISLKDIVVSNGGDVEVVQRKMARDLWSDTGLRFIRW